VDSFIGHYMVPFFFIGGTLTILFIASKFLSQKANIYRNIGIGLALYGVAFAIWSVAVITKPTNLETYTTVGVVPFALAHIFYLLAGTEKVKAANRSLILMLGVGYLAIILVLRSFVYKSHPAFSANGLFYFHADPSIVALYIGAFAASLLPAINAVSQKIKDQTLKFVSQFGFTILAIGGIVMLTSYSDTLQTINGYVMGTTFVVLLLTYSTKKLK
jgi:hypothetical protein